MRGWNLPVISVEKWDLCTGTAGFTERITIQNGNGIRISTKSAAS